MAFRLRARAVWLGFIALATIANGAALAITLFTEASVAEPATVAWGDLNCDGSFDLADSLRMRRALAGLDAQACPESTAPTATAIPVTPVPHAFGYGECAGGNCGNPPLLVICAPDGWFVDVGRDFPNPGWPSVEVTRAVEASGAC